MDAFPPTTADYAMSAAESARRENKTLEQRVERLEKRLMKIEKLLKALTERE